MSPRRYHTIQRRRKITHSRGRCVAESLRSSKLTGYRTQIGDGIYCPLICVCQARTLFRAQFTRRDTIYSQHSIKAQDALLILCTITSSPYVPPPVPTVPLRSVPKSLVDTMGSLLDDPVYSDVEFIIPRPPNNFRNARTIWASRKMLQRVDYFDASDCRSFLARGLSALTYFASVQLKLCRRNVGCTRGNVTEHMPKH